MIAKIIVDNKSKQVDKPFDYLVPKELEGKIKIGSRVLVLYLYGAEAHFAAGGFDNVSVGVVQADDKCIEIRCFGRPLQWFFDCFWGELHFCLAVACACG